MTTRDSFTGWRKAIRSKDDDACVEVGRGTEGVGVADTKDFGTGPILEFGKAEWGLFLTKVKGGAYRPGTS